MQTPTLTEKQYLDVLTIIDNKAKNPTQADIPKEAISLIARVLFNLERIAIAQEIIAGIRAGELLP